MPKHRKSKGTSWAIEQYLGQDTTAQSLPRSSGYHANPATGSQQLSAASGSASDAPPAVFAKRIPLNSIIDPELLWRPRPVQNSMYSAGDANLDLWTAQAVTGQFDQTSEFLEPNLCALPIAQGVTLRDEYPTLFKYGLDEQAAFKANQEAAFEEGDFDSFLSEKQTRSDRRHVLESELSNFFSSWQIYTALCSGTGTQELSQILSETWPEEARRFVSDGHQVLALGDQSDGIVDGKWAYEG